MPEDNEVTEDEIRGWIGDEISKLKVPSEEGIQNIISNALLKFKEENPTNSGGSSNLDENSLLEKIGKMVDEKIGASKNSPRSPGPLARALGAR